MDVPLLNNKNKGFSTMKQNKKNGSYLSNFDLLVYELNNAIDKTEEQGGSVGIYDLAYSISEIVKEHWGEHNYKAFKDVIKSQLRS